MKNTIRYCVEYQKYYDEHDSSKSWGQLYFKTLEEAKIKLKELNNYVNRIYIEEFYNGEWDCNEEPLFLNYSTGEFYK